MPHDLQRLFHTGAAGLLTALLLILAASPAAAQELREGYLTPPDHIAQHVLAPRHENVTLSNLSPSGEVFLNTQSMGLSPLAAWARPHRNIAGLQIDPQANRTRSFTTSTTTGLELIDATDGSVRTIDTPQGAGISTVRWSPDGSQVAFFAHYDDATHLYVADLATGASTRVSEAPLLATLTTSADWSGDGQHLFAVVVPGDRGAAPTRPAVPTALQVRKTTDSENRLRTYPSLLEDPHEADLLRYYTTGQLVRINVANGTTDAIGAPAMIRSIDPAPTGDYVRVQTVQEPFSYIVPARMFGWTEEIWDLEGEPMVTLRTADVRDGDPEADAMEDFNRSFISWRPDGEGLSFVLKPDEDEEEDNSDANGETDADDDEEAADDTSDKHRVMQWLPPFDDDSQRVVYAADRQIRGLTYNDAADLLFLQERHRGDDHLFAVFTDEPDSTYTIYRKDRDDFYDIPGSLSTTTGSLGARVARLTSDGEHVYLSGTQYFEDFETEAPRPFLDRVAIRTGETERLFESAEDTYERITAMLDDEATQLMLERQSPTMLPNSFRLDLASGDRTQLTQNSDPDEAVTQAQRERFKVERADGFTFWMEVVMPADWDGERLPGLLWHYPREVDDQEDYDDGLRRYNKNTYPRIGSRTADILVQHGYAVLKPDWPITGARGTSNDNFVWSIVQNSTAVLDAAYERGFIDRNRMAIGGHSYGAFGTANAMIHTSFFKAGIAGAGNYNRTLTPIGFQRERADLWRGADRYIQMSPIFWADRLDGALLMYHGAEDQNVGTWPINSERMFHALNGLGKTAALYMYPYEGHGQRAEETLLDMWARWADWLDAHVKHAGEDVDPTEVATAP